MIGVVIGNFGVFIGVENIVGIGDVFKNFGVFIGVENIVWIGDVFKNFGVFIGVENIVGIGDVFKIFGVFIGVRIGVRATVLAVGGTINIDVAYILHELVVLYGICVSGVAWYTNCDGDGTCVIDAGTMSLILKLLFLEYGCSS